MEVDQCGTVLVRDLGSRKHSVHGVRPADTPGVVHGWSVIYPAPGRCFMHCSITELVFVQHSLAETSKTELIHDFRQQNADGRECQPVITRFRLSMPAHRTLFTMKW